MRNILLQIKFFLVAFLNLSYNLFPNPIRKFYLRIWGIKIGPHSSIHRFCRFFHVGKFEVGKNSTINFGCFIDNRRGVKIGDNVGIAHNTKIYTLGHNIDSPYFETKGAPVVIENDVFIFSNVLVMPGVTIHKGAVVLAGSVITKDVEEYSVVGGAPAKVIRTRSKEIKYSQAYNYWFAL